MNKSITLYFEKLDARVTFTKLNDEEWYDLNQAFAPISVDWDFIMMLEFHHYKKQDFDLAKMYMVLYTLFGPHNAYDDFKCTFSYNFKLKIEKEGKQLEYGLDVTEVKGHMPYFTYYRKTLQDESVNVYQNPMQDEFSNKNMRHCPMGFIHFLERFFYIYKSYFKQNFYRVNRSAYLIYGFEDKDFFVNQYPYQTEEDAGNFQLAINTFKEDEAFNTPMSKQFWKLEEII